MTLSVPQRVIILNICNFLRKWKKYKLSVFPLSSKMENKNNIKQMLEVQGRLAQMDKFLLCNIYLQQDRGRDRLTPGFCMRNKYLIGREFAL